MYLFLGHNEELNFNLNASIGLCVYCFILSAELKFISQMSVKKKEDCNPT